MSDDRFNRLPGPPSPMFLGEPERDLTKQLNDEILERVVGQQIAYYPISREHTNYNQYGEAIIKNFLPPIRIYVLVLWEGIETSTNTSIGPDKISKIKIWFHKRRLSEDQKLVVMNGDFVVYGDRFYELVKVGEPRELFGQADHRFEIAAEAIQSRREIFNGT